MTVNSYLTNLANQAIIRNAEKESIQRSINTIITRLNLHFGDQLGNHFTFGSYPRNTILPRSMDSNSDIDYMVVFKDGSYRPQTYLDSLRRFVNRYYQRSEINQSHPTIVLNLNHIRFELVPAKSGWFSGLQIPDKASSFNNWLDTDPSSFNTELTNKNGSHQSLIKPLCRLVKYWNASNGYPFESYYLENQIVDHSFWMIGGLLSGLQKCQLKDYFFEFMQGLECSMFDSQAKKAKVASAKTTTSAVKKYLAGGNEYQAEQQIKHLLPPILTAAGLLGGLGR
jgi:hypothetical protein